MKKRVILASALAALTLSIASPAVAASTTFTDVPTNHWSYDALDYLTKAGIVDGYKDSTFRGDKTMTRYEMSQIVYKAMQNQDKANIAQKALIDKLAAEYALEMNKIESIDTRLTKVEKEQTVKFSGRLLEQYKVKNMDTQPGWAAGQYQVRLNISAKVDQDTTVGIRIANPAPTQMMFKNSNANRFGAYTGYGTTGDNSFIADRFFAVTKTGATNITVGRQAMDIDPEDVIVDSSFFSFDGVKVASKLGKFDVSALRGRFYKNIDSGTQFGFNGRPKAEFASADVDSVKIAAKTGNLSYGAGWMRLTNNVNVVSDKTLMNYYYGNAGYRFADNFSMSAEVGKNTKASLGNSDGQFGMVSAKYGAQSLNAKGKQNFTITYLKSGRYGVNEQFTSFDQPAEETNGDGWTNLDLAYRYAFSSKMIGKLEYGTIKDNDKSSESYKLWKAQILYNF